MRILQLITRNQLRGAEVFATRLSGELAAAGHEVTLAALYSGSPSLAPSNQVDLVELAGNPSGGLSPGLAVRLRNLVGGRCPDIIQANGSDTLKYAVAATRFTRSRTPLVYRNISMISHWTTDPFRLHLVRYLLRRVDVVASVSEASRLDLLSASLLDERRVVCIERGVPVPSTVDRAVARARLNGLIPGLAEWPLLFHIGSHTAEKNHRGLLNIFGRVRSKRPDVHLVLLGAGPLTGEIQSLTCEAGFAQYVHFLGVRADVADLLAAADVLVLPSNVEGIPGAILEAAAVEVPAVAYDVGGVAEVVRSGLTGLLVARDDVDGFAAAVLQLLGAEMTRREMGGNARQYVLEHHSLSTSAARFEDLYRQLLIKAAR